MSKQCITVIFAGLLMVGLFPSIADAQTIELSALDLASRTELAWADDEFDNKKPSTKDVESRAQSGDKKSLFKAGLYSALIPGLGEYYVGNRKKARIFFAADAVTWIGFASYRIYGHEKEQDYVRFAQTNANAQLENKSDEFRDLVGFYTNINEYNTFGRVFDTDRPYLVDSPENHWQWESEADRATYRHLKNRSREAYRTSDFFIGIALVTRVVSIIDAVRDVKRYNSRLDREFSEAPVRLELNPFSPTKQVVLSVRTPF
ncbi:MAG: hypothetical protein IPH75_06365 [bacterium]|nr:hypothetical protein [bacterium]